MSWSSALRHMSAVLAFSGTDKLYFSCFAFVLLCALAIFLWLGIRTVPVGAKGLVIFLGRRTEEIRGEGIFWTWPLLTKVQVIYVRERQIDIPKAEYYTADRARISFKTALRVTVSDARALVDQGPGTYLPFTREGYGDFAQGSQEANIALSGLVQNSIRESVRSLNIHDVMFGGRSEHVIRDRVLTQLARTVRRWGLEVVDVWLTDIDADDGALKQAVQSEVQEVMRGRGQMAKDEARISKGALVGKVAMELADDVRRRLGRDVDVGEVSDFLLTFYHNERALEVALESAGSGGSGSDLLQLFYLHHLGVPMPAQPRPGQLGAYRVFGSLATPRTELPEGSWIVGRDGDIIVDWDGVSRRHARLELYGGRMTITDLGSTNGTFLNGQQLSPNTATKLSPGDTIRFGQNVTHSTDELIDAVCRGG